MFTTGFWQPSDDEHHVEYDDLLAKAIDKYEKNLDLSFVEKLIYDSQMEQSVSFEDGRVTKIMFSKLKTIELACFVMNLLTMSLVVIQYEIAYYSEHPEWSDTILYMILAVTKVAVILIVFRYLSQLKFLQKRNILSEKDNLYSSGLWTSMVLEIIFTLIIPLPWAEDIVVYSKTLTDGFELQSQLNEIFSLFSALRLLVLLRYFALESYWSSNRAQRLCDMHAVEPGMMFTVKCIMKKTPFTFVFSAYLLSIPYFAWMLRIAEKPSNQDLTPGYLGYNYANSMWNVLITMTTVGYGDYFPRTFLGRTVIFFVCLWGTISMSLMVVTVTNVFQMSTLEAKTYNVLERLKKKENLQRQSAKVVTNIIKGKRVSQAQGKISEEHLKQVKINLKKFKNANRRYRELTNENLGFETMASYFEILNEKVNEVTKVQTAIADVLKQIVPAVGLDINESQKQPKPNPKGRKQDLKAEEKKERRRTSISAFSKKND